MFEHEGFLYRSTGRRLGFGGMGNCFLVERKAAANVELCVLKTFHANYLHQLRTDEVTRRDYDAVVRNMRRIRGLTHPHILPTYAAEPSSDNYVTVTPLMDATLRQAIAVQSIPSRRRIEYLIQALHGLAHMHSSGLIHRDFTLRNILVQEDQAFLFDFDLTVALDDVVGETYRSYYRGRVFGSPGYSVPPEVLDRELMDLPITPQLDIYAIGSAIFSLFTDQLPTGASEDMWGLLLKVSEGLVKNGRSRIVYPAQVPNVLRPIIEHCMERNPRHRFQSVPMVIKALEQALPTIPLENESQARRVTWTGTNIHQMDAPLHAKLGESEFLQKVASSLEPEGYQLIRSLGEVSGNPIFVAAPDPVLLAEGRFPDTNIYPKIVTVKALPREEAAVNALVDRWFGCYSPLLQRARQGLLTPLHRVCWDPRNRVLMLLSEYVEDARFGPALDQHQLTQAQALALAKLVGNQVRRIHEVGLAHNNVCTESLLFKAIPLKARVFPAMVGLVDPSERPEDMGQDVRNLADLALGWLQGPYRDDDDDTLLSEVSEALTAPLRALTMNWGTPGPSIDDFDRAVTAGFAHVDRNFGILRAHDGDLEEYCLMVVSDALSSRLWGT